MIALFNKVGVRHILIISILIVGFVSLALPQTFPSSSAKPQITRPSVKPSRGEPGDTYLFLSTYNDPDNIPPDFIQLVIDNKRHNLTPVSLKDDDYTDGKDYMIKLKLSEGLHLYYFEAANMNGSATSSAATIHIEDESEFTHLDVAYSLLIATVIILIPLLYGLYQLRKLTRILATKSNTDNHPRSKTRIKKDPKI